MKSVTIILKRGIRLNCVSHLSKVISRECLLNGFQLTLSFFFCSCHCSQVFSCAQHSLLSKYLEPRPNIVGVVLSKTWVCLVASHGDSRVSGDSEFGLPRRDLYSSLPLAEMFVHESHALQPPLY